MNNCFSLSITIPVKYSTVLLVLYYVAKNYWSYKHFFAQINTHNNFLFKDGTSETESSCPIKYFNENKNKNKYIR